MGSVPMLDNAPDLYEYLGFELGAFNELSMARTQGFSGGNPIAISEILAWSQINGVHGDTLVDLVEYIQAMDQVYLNHGREKDGGT